MEEPGIGARALIAHTIPLLYRPLQVGKSPELSIRRRRCRTKQFTWSIAMQPISQLFQLCLRQFGPITTDTLVYQAIDPIAPILAAPIHKAGATAARDVHNLLDRVAGAVQPDGLVAGAGGTIFAVCVGALQSVTLCFRYLKSSFCHLRIVRLLFKMSIR